MILYYADFLSLKDISIPVTDNCKYYYIHDNPINSAYLDKRKPFYNVDNKYLIQAQNEIGQIKDVFNEDGTISFLGRICNLQALGTVDGKQMLDCIHIYSEKKTRKTALDTYTNWKNNKKYFHTTLDDDGDPRRTECSQYVARAEQGTWTNPTFNIEGSIIERKL